MGLLNLRNALMAGTKWKNPYVTDGLVAMWDGEWNACGGVHDPSATVCKDLTGNGYDLIVNGATISDKYFSTSSSGRLYGVFTIPNVVSVECVFREYSTLQYSMCVWVNNAQGSIARSTRIMVASSRTGYCDRGFSCSSDDISTLSFVNVGTSALFGAKNGIVSTLQQATTDWGVGTGICIGARLRTLNPLGFDYPSNGDYYSVRLYSRALTAAEIARNYAIDQERFNLS